VVGRFMGASHSTVWEVLHEHGQHPFSRTPIHALTPLDYPLQVDFCDTILARCMVDPDFPDFILFTDKKCFKREGSFNNQNHHSWSDENPHASCVRGFQHCSSINLWVGIVGDHLIGPHRFPGPLNGATYLEFLQDSLPELLENVPVNVRARMWYQHDGAPPHYDRAVREYLMELFQGRDIHRGVPIGGIAIAWPTRSPDLTLPDFFVWGVYDSLVHDHVRGPIADKADLQQRIDEATCIVGPRSRWLWDVRHGSDQVMHRFGMFFFLQMFVFVLDV